MGWSPGGSPPSPALLAQDPAERERLAGAMREAVLNAILHADYFSRGGLAILRTAGKLTVSNGGLLRVDPDQARQGAAGDPRNRGLVALFALLKLATGTGRGLRGIYALWAQQGWQAPVLAEAAHAERTDLSLPLPHGPSPGRNSPGSRFWNTSPTTSPPPPAPWPRGWGSPSGRSKGPWPS